MLCIERLGSLISRACNFFLYVSIDKGLEELFLFSIIRCARLVGLRDWEFS